MRILAASRGGEALLLVDHEGAANGQVLDVHGRKLYPVMPVESIYARGGWIEYEGPQDADERLQDAERIPAVGEVYEE